MKRLLQADDFAEVASTLQWVQGIPRSILKSQLIHLLLSRCLYSPIDFYYVELKQVFYNACIANSSFNAPNAQLILRKMQQYKIHFQYFEHELKSLANFTNDMDMLKEHLEQSHIAYKEYKNTREQEDPLIDMHFKIQELAENKISTIHELEENEEKIQRAFSDLEEKIEELSDLGSKERHR